MATINQQKGGKYSVRVGNQKFNGLSRQEAQGRADSNYQIAPDSVTDTPAQKRENAALGISPGDSNAARDAALSAAKVPAAPGGQVNTSQPSPGTVPVGPQSVADPRQQALDSLRSQGYASPDEGEMQGAMGISSVAPTDVGEQMRQGLAAVKGSGANVPETQGQAQATIARSVAPQAYKPAPDIQTEVDDSLKSYAAAVAQYLNPDNQRKTLVQEYQSLSKSLGIPDLQDDLLDINRIMDGTEDDIRSEVTAAAGFATDSQVQAMTIGRNKSLLKKAQYISDQLTAAKDQLQTLSQLNAQDRQFADQRMQNGIALLGNMVQIKQSMQKAAQDNYRWYAEKAGIDSLYASTGGDPFNVAMVEKTLGMPAGGLQTAAIQAQKDRRQKESDDALERAYKGLRNQQMQGEIDAASDNSVSSGGSIPNAVLGKATESERKGYGFLNRAINAQSVVDQLEAPSTEGGKGYKKSGILTNLYNSVVGTKVPFTDDFRPGKAVGLQTQNYESFNQGAEDFIYAVLRLESGATIPPDEMSNYKRTYFPIAGDSSETIKQKQQSRETAVNFLRSVSGRLAPYADKNKFQEYSSLIKNASPEQLRELGINQ